MRIYGIKACDTCRKVIKTFPDADFVDIRETPLSSEFLAARLTEFGATLINTRSTTWRNLDDTQKESAPLELLIAHPTLMKRPLIEQEGRFTLGWTKDVQASYGV